MVKYNIQDTIHNTIDFIDTILDDGFIPPGYSVEDVERLREAMSTCWEQLEDGVLKI